MLFNNPFYFIFLGLVFIIYWSLSTRKQNVFIIISSYVFYGLWKWEYLLLILICTLSSYFCGLKISREQKKAGKKYLIAGISTNLLILFVFKYYNFFIDSVVSSLNLIGIQSDFTYSRLILPVGISFYIFQSISYVVDVYRDKQSVTEKWIDFTAYISFFPQLVAGPIERAKDMITQFGQKRRISYDMFADGGRLIIWGLFKKIVVADNLATFVDRWYSNVNASEGWELLIGIYFFAFQIYCDFSGYSDIAIGSAKILGFNLSVNFKLPYFSETPSEFWRRWHITLSTWLRDYLFMPIAFFTGKRSDNLNLSSKDKDNISYSASTLGTMFLGGLWHGASWNFAIWGLLHGLYMVIYRLTGLEKKIRSRKYMKKSPGLKKFFNIFLTFHLVLFSWFFFRVESLKDIPAVFTKIVTSGFPALSELRSLMFPVFIIVVLVLIEWFTRNQKAVLNFRKLPAYVRYPLYNILVLLLIILGKFSHAPFIYFQF